MATDTESKVPATTDKPAVQKSARKEGAIPRNHDEWMEMNNANIEAQAVMEAEQQEKNQEEARAIAEDTGRAVHNVVVEGGGTEGTPLRFESLQAVEVYGRKGMARYDVDEGDTYIKIVLVDAVIEAQAKKDKEEEQKK